MQTRPAHCRILLLSILFLGLALLVSAPRPTAAQAPARPIPSTIPVPDDIYDGLARAISSRPAGILPGDKVIITSLDKTDGWAISTIALVPDRPDEGESLLAHSTLAIVRFSSGRWSGALLGTQAYENLLTASPASLVSARSKVFLRSARFSHSISPSAMLTALKWPWLQGQTWMYTQGRHGTNSSSIDLGPFDIIPVGDRAVVAAAGGVVIRKCDDDVQSSLAIRHTTGGATDEVTSYLHMDKNTVTRATGSPIQQGESIGLTYNDPIPYQTWRCGYSTGPHVHFSTGVIAAGSNNKDGITYTDIAGTTISGWTLGTDDCFRNGGETRCVLDSFVSDNGILPSPPSNPTPANGSTLPRTNNTTLLWATNGTSCDGRVWGGRIDISPGAGPCGSYPLGVQKGGSYKWQVTAHNSNGATMGPVWTFNIRPYGPTGLTATPASATAVNLLWTKSVDDPGDVDSYKVYRNGALLTTLPSGTTSFQATGLSCNTPYSFYVTSVRQGVESVASNTASATPTCTCFALTRTVSPSSSGTINTSPAPNCNVGTQYISGTVVALTAVPGSGFSFSAWSGDASGSASPTSVTMSADKSVTATFVPVANLLVNGDFEQGRGVGWTEYSSGGYPIVGTRNPHAGSYSAYFCDYNSCTEYIQQKVTIPANATLSYWWYMTSTAGTATASDYLRVRLYSTTGVLIATPRIRSNTATRNTWVQDTVSLAAYSGRTVFLRFQATTNASLPTAFYVDDAQLTAAAPPPPPPPPPPACYTLGKVASPGNGGSVGASPAPDCNSGTQYTSGTMVTLTATANPGMQFSSWTGCDTTSGTTCQVSMTADRSVAANFVPLVVSSLVNGDFEQGRGVGWAEYSSGGYPIVGTNRPRTGSYSAYFCGYNNCTEYIDQQITIPANASLTYWWYMTSSDSTTIAADYFRIRLYSTGGTLLTSLRGRSNLGTRNAWQQDTISLSAYAGQTVVLRFLTTTNASAPTSFWVDDVTVQ